MRHLALAVLLVLSYGCGDESKSQDSKTPQYPLAIQSPDGKLYYLVGSHTIAGILARREQLDNQFPTEYWILTVPSKMVQNAQISDPSIATSHFENPCSDMELTLHRKSFAPSTESEMITETYHSGDPDLSGIGQVYVDHDGNILGMFDAKHAGGESTTGTLPDPKIQTQAISPAYCDAASNPW